MHMSYDEASREVTFAIESPELPSSLGLMAGDVVHAWRASLDNLVEAMLQRNDWPSSVRHQFPIEDTYNSKGRKNITDATRGVSDGDLEAINKLQPFTLGDDAEGHPLVALRALSNYDKHHVIVPIVHSHALQIKPAGSDQWVSATHASLAFPAGRRTPVNWWLQGIKGAEAESIDVPSPNPDGVILRLVLKDVTQPRPELFVDDIPIEMVFWTPETYANYARLEQIRDQLWDVLRETDQRWTAEDTSGAG